VEEQKDSIFLLFTGELAKRQISQQREYVERVEETSDLDALAKEDRDLLTQEGQDSSCADK
jgi:hypothetical protein